MGLISNGTTIFDNGSMASGFGGNLIFISKQTASASATISFTSGIDSTYKEYVFYFVNIHGSIDDTGLTFNFSTDGGSNYNVTKTTTFFTAEHGENDAGASLGYRAGGDLAQSTAFARLDNDFGADNDQSMVGEFHLFNPSSTTYVKHFIHRSQTSRHVDYTSDNYTAGYGNTTSAINAIQFKMNSGNIDAGEILLFGVN